MKLKNKSNLSDLQLKTYQSFTSMIDFISCENILTERRQSKCCYWDRCPIPDEDCLLGIPIKYVPEQVEQIYFSELVQKIYIMHKTVYQNDSIDKEEMCLKLLEINKQNKPFYITFGFVCSFNCMFSFIYDNSKNPLFHDSIHLAMKLYIECGGTLKQIIPAPSWTLLSQYGGPFDIDTFRELFDKVSFETLGELRINKPICKTFGLEFIEKHNLTF